LVEAASAIPTITQVFIFSPLQISINAGHQRLRPDPIGCRRVGAPRITAMAS
jgi:hypothetical protein